ncbi:hypothetical protein HMPREF3027_03610 [Porphyromonas sp. HMSC077F02]|uniref:hypothetical protein n=1 Tax=Porphyromonas sp. HMSC077F02 TaxID=1739529 RepID=UPI0008A2723E|nr:hypothetical protein [Porphyromonas sp. HMSC077F02]OFO55216.1 hypothetical protein HMPREF3027_03610 [Porphyromonas sp. HMSC077F02]
MVTKYLKLFAATVVALFALAACQNERTIDLYGEEGGPNALDVTFTIKDYDEVNLRSHLRPVDEHRIEDLAVWVFDTHGDIIGDVLISHDPKKDFGFIALDGPATGDGGSVGKGIPFGGTKTKGELGNRLTFQVKQTGGDVTVVALANFVSDNFAIEDADSGEDYTDAMLKAIKTLDELKGLRLNTNNSNHEFASTERYESPLMYAVQPVTQDQIKAGKVSIQLVPFIAKITTSIKAGEGVTINAVSYHFQNIPTRTDIYNAIVKNQDDIKELSSPSVQMLVDEETNSFHAEGYLIPNYPECKRKITGDDIATSQLQKKDAKSGFTAFDLRQKRVKKDLGDGTVENGAWEYAPDDATTFVMEADLTIRKDGNDQQAYITYTVVLGDFSGVSDWVNPTVEDFKKINNYFIESATHYNYTITINGVDNIIVEAKSADKLDEPNSSVEGGTVIGNKPVYQLDSHYEQRTMLLSAADFDVFKSAGNRELKDGAKLQFMVQTPFQPLKLVTYTMNEAETARKSGVPENKQVDNDWIRIYVHKPPVGGGFDADNLPEVLYSDTEESGKGASTATYWGKTLTVEQFFAWLLTNPNPLFDRNNAICITLFVDEFYYDWDPIKYPTKESRTADKKDPTLWKTFANAPDRKFFLLAGNIHTSADRQSHFTEGTYVSLSQHSIKTFFTEAPEGIRVWGVESIDETPNTRWYFRAPSSITRYGNKHTANGWINTVNVLGTSDYYVDKKSGIEGYANWLKEKADATTGFVFVNDQRGYGGYPKQAERIWQQRTKGLANGVTFNDRKYANLTPYLRNRDVNRDGKFQTNELKWYIPSQLEAELLVLLEQSLPSYARLKAPLDATFKNPLLLYTSTWFDDYTSNTVCISKDIVSAAPLWQFRNGYKFSLDQTRSTVRLIRDLGIIEKSSIEDPSGRSYNFDDKYYVGNANKFFKFIPNVSDTLQWTAKSKDFGGVFVGYDHVGASASRFAYADKELPRHNEKDAAMRLYYKGFRLSKNYVGSSDYDIDAKPFRWKFADIREQLNYGVSPCSKYHEERDFSDLGKWRLPNMTELAMIGLGVPNTNYFNRIANKRSTDAVFITWSSTILSKDEDNVESQFFMRVDNDLAYPMSKDAPGYGSQSDTWKGYVRCVRDLSDAEWNKYKNMK